MRRWQSLALLAVLLPGCRPAPVPQQETPAALVGAWRSRIQFTSGAFASISDLEFMYVFNSGGTLTESSNYDGAPPVPPAYGVWRTISPTEFEAKYEFYVTAPAPPDAFRTGAGWLPSGRGVFTERITIGADGSSFTSTVSYEAFDNQGKPADGGGTATGHGVRIAF